MLRDLGIERQVMLTGDETSVAAAVARAAGMTEWHSRLLPEDKLKAVRHLREGGRLAMVGDGVNDAPALAAADVGTGGSDVAIENGRHCPGVRRPPSRGRDGSTEPGDHGRHFARITPWLWA